MNDSAIEQIVVTDKPYNNKQAVKRATLLNPDGSPYNPSTPPSEFELPITGDDLVLTGYTPGVEGDLSSADTGNEAFSKLRRMIDEIDNEEPTSDVVRAPFVDAFVLVLNYESTVNLFKSESNPLTYPAGANIYVFDLLPGSDLGSILTSTGSGEPMVSNADIQPKVGDVYLSGQYRIHPTSTVINRPLVWHIGTYLGVPTPVSLMPSKVLTQNLDKEAFFGDIVIIQATDDHEITINEFVTTSPRRRRVDFYRYPDIEGPHTVTVDLQVGAIDGPEIPFGHSWVHDISSSGDTFQWGKHPGLIPSAFSGAGAGTTPGSPEFSESSTDLQGSVTLTTGTACPSTGLVIETDLGLNLVEGYSVTLTPGNGLAAQAEVFVQIVDDSTWRIQAASALEDSSEYIWHYSIKKRSTV